MARELFVLTDCDDPSNALVKSFTDDSAPEAPVITRSDDSKWRFHWLKRNPAQIPGRPFVYLDAPPVTVKVGAGEIDEPPDGGTFTGTETQASQTTGNIAFNASAGTLQTALRAAWTTHFSACVVTGSNPWTIDRGVTGAYTFNPTFNEAGLTPSGSIATVINSQQGTSLLNEKWQLRLSKALCFFQSTFTDFDAASTASSILQNGSATASKVYTLTWSADAVDGATYWSVSSTGSDNETIGPISYAATSDEVAAAFNKHSAFDDDATTNVQVEQAGPGSYTVKFATSFENTPTIGATASSSTLKVPVGSEADIATDTVLADAILGASTSEDIIFEIEIREESGKPRTIVQTTATLKADLIAGVPQSTAVEVYLTLADATDGTLNLVVDTVEATSFLDVNADTVISGDGFWFTGPAVYGIQPAGDGFSFNIRSGNATVMTIDGSGAIQCGGVALTAGVLALPAYTVGTLPAGSVGDMAYVTDATAPTYNGALTGGGAIKVPVFYNGSAWVSH